MGFFITRPWPLFRTPNWGTGQLMRSVRKWLADCCRFFLGAKNPRLFFFNVYINGCAKTWIWMVSASQMLLGDRWFQRFFAYFAPLFWGEMIQFDGLHFFRWVEPVDFSGSCKGW